MPKSKYTKGKDGRWRTAVRTGEYDEQGRPILIRLSSSRSSADLEKKVREVKYRIEHRRSYVDVSDITLRDYAEKWLATKEQRSIKTYEMYDLICRKYLDDLGDMRLVDIRQSDVQLLINRNSDHPRTCQQIKLTMDQIFNMAVNEDIIDKTPCRNIELPRHLKKEQRTLTEKERAIVKAGKGLTPIQKAYIHVLYGTGVRPGEAQAITWSDVDFKACTITINKALQFTNSRMASVGLPKTNKSVRTLPVPTFVMTSILALKRSRVCLSTCTLFGTDTGELRTRSAYKNIFDTAMKTLGITDAHPYMMRHAFCSLCYFNGVDIKTCQALLGHSDVKMVLQVYSHFENKDKALKAAIDTLNF